MPLGRHLTRERQVGGGSTAHISPGNAASCAPVGSPDLTARPCVGGDNNCHAALTLVRLSGHTGTSASAPAGREGRAVGPRTTGTVCQDLLAEYGSVVHRGMTHDR